MYFLSWLFLGLFAGWMTGRFLKGNEYGPFMDVVMGIAGALAGGFLIGYAGLSGLVGIIFTTLSAILGAVALTILTAVVNGRKKYA